MIRHLLMVMCLLMGSLHAEYFHPFPGFKTMLDHAAFVGIVKLESPSDSSAFVGSSFRCFTVRSQVVFKGNAIQGEVARLADRRLSILGDQHQNWPFEDILEPEKSFLVFLSGPSPAALSSGLFKWDELHYEGAVLPLSPLISAGNYDEKKPLESFSKVVRDHSQYCDQMAACARKQKEWIEKMTKDGK